MNQFFNGSEMSTSMTGAVVQTDVKSFLLRVYNWMAMGLAITGLTAFAVSSSESMIELFIMNKILTNFKWFFTLSYTMIYIFSIAYRTGMFDDPS